MERTRVASRRLVRELDVLRGLGGRTVTQCHALLEVSRAGRLSPSDLARVLRLDRSTITRALAPLIDGGELKVELDAQNARSRPVDLTARGRRLVAEIDRLSDDRVCRALELLGEEDRTRILAGLTLYAEVLRRSRERADVVIRPLRVRDAAAMTRIIRAVMPEFGATGPGTALEDPELDQIYSTFRAERHAFFIARRGDHVLGGCGIAPLRGGAAEICELQKLYLLPETRGLSLGRDLVRTCLHAARSHGYQKCYLETIAEMVQAHKLYASLGFRALDKPMGATGHFRCSNWLLLDLTS